MCFLFSTISKLPNQNSTTKMLRHLLTILTSLSVCTAANLTSQIELIRNPPHHANYSPPYTPSPSDDPARLLIIGDVHGMLDQLEQNAASALRVDKVDLRATGTGSWCIIKHPYTAATQNRGCGPDI